MLGRCLPSTDSHTIVHKVYEYSELGSTHLIIALCFILFRLTVSDTHNNLKQHKSHRVIITDVPYMILQCWGNGNW